MLVSRQTEKENEVSSTVLKNRRAKNRRAKFIVGPGLKCTLHDGRIWLIFDCVTTDHFQMRDNALNRISNKHEQFDVWFHQL